MGTTTYLDNNATTPIDSRVAEKFYQLCQEFWANASSLHSLGQKTQQELIESRERIAECLGATRDEIYFTSGGTESNNLFLQGLFQKLLPLKGKVLTSTIEHPAVLNVFEHFASRGGKVEYLPVNEEGRVELGLFQRKLTPEVGLVALMMANNETGVLQSIQEMGKICREHGAVFFSDGVQTVGKLPLNVKELGVHGLSFSGHKFYGPKGVGGLYVESSVKLPALQFGGHQERGLRPGTENVPAISAMSWALKYACEEMQVTEKRMKQLKERLLQGFSTLEGVQINGSLVYSLPNTLNIAIQGVQAESLMVNLDLHNIAISTGSACSSGATEPSHVLQAMGLSRERCKSSIRISMGKQNTEQDIDFFLKIFPSCIQRLREVAF
ncbi:MAG: cysteine desulfurase family protein [Planctomycetota bacterium]